MKKYKALVMSIAITALGLNSCKKGCTDPSATNFDERAKKDDNSCEYEDPDSYTVPSTYAFVDADGNSTVSYSGQFQRLDMLSEMITYMKTANTQGVFVDAQTLKDMYENNSYTWTDNNSLGMTGSTKQLKNKTAYASAGGSADAGVQALFEAYMDSLDIISNYNQTGSVGVAGVWPNDGEKGPYLMDGDGREYTQLIEKGLMSAVFASQITVQYLELVTNDDNSTLVTGENYTDMQHHWDEAYGYFTESVDYPSNGTDRFWGEYADGRESVLNSATKISTAFRTGRAAIDNLDYETRDAQIKIIRDELEKIAAGTAIHYLNAAKSYLASGNATARNHVLSEAWAFLDGMRYGYNCISGDGMTASQIDAALAYFEDFNTVGVTGMNMAIDAIASATGLTDVKNDL
ncbi:DUF4856 domain-containing protein [Parvicella tangerina]|uniref:DUF4856 domain-containing protein n=1 Tax=Parvicella tangerina TaxID=2829795 RepID=A0A916JIC5_9FLAO|nr:DUF4856 domain-containing protein [Parvicella tangerina]CAG5076283.1 hypothetical protein CRYO30217_00038 [Parvicella tangerina]